MSPETVQVLSAAISALATAAILIATICYVLYTRRLWKETQRAAEHTAHQIDLTRQQIHLATKEIEARLRPYVTTRPRKEWSDNGGARFRFVLVNKGLIPAHIRSVQVRCWLNDDEVPMHQAQESVLFPGGQRKTPWNSVAAPVKSGELRWRISVSVEYTGGWDVKPYVTEYTKRWNHTTRAWVNEHIKVT